jgi:hypothetical protein
MKIERGQGFIDKMKQTEYTFQDVIFYALDSLKEERDADGKLIKESKMEGFPSLDKIGICVPELRGKSPQEVLDFFEAQGNEFLHFREDSELTPVYSVVGIIYAANGSPRPDKNKGLRELGSQIKCNLGEVADGFDRMARGRKLLHTEAKDGVLLEDENEIILTLEKYCALGKPAELVKDGDEVRAK